ncbi:hypothetical protein Aph02nite_48890 [Actinoplanes philippinensis]|uniref:Uncharacterized protein n=1 Tax=Actinoplanes philippinensis TaxID=35752 RepID=A0A1I2ITH8_9ACTN|nr:hypothetical protein [Actinoplanes philippinensis]GIE78939.1 hypothetical protein Aph02nite_48890 [Actinoplanes philippinensis]SFF45594.1 hypothetical protein SAMN05421541_110473 [Actinoplanes philippinensis]
MTSISDRLTDLAHRLSGILDVPSEKELRDVLFAAGWQPSRHHTAAVLQLGEMLAYTLPEPCSAHLVIGIHDFGDPQELDGEESAQLYQEAETLAADIAAELRLDPAGPFDIDPLEGVHLAPHRFRAGHWAAGVADVQYDADLPLIVEAHFAWGANLQDRLTALVPPPARPPVVDWATIARPLPADYRWLIDTYGPGPLGGVLDLTAPGRLPAPRSGPDLFPERLAMATCGDDGTLSWIMDSTRPWESDPVEEVNSWHLELSRPGLRRGYGCGLLHFIVLALTGKHEPAATD